MLRHLLLSGTGAAVLLTALPAIAQDATDIDIAVNRLARSLDPADRTGNVDVRVYYSIYDTLIRRNFRDVPEVGVTLEPGLAESWTRPEPNVLEVTLRQGVTCHDGTPFNAEDVLFTFSPERLWGEDSFYSAGRIYFGHLESVEAVDDYTVRFTTTVADPIFEARLSSYTAFLVCDEAWTALADDRPFAEWMEAATEQMNWAPVGTGPYAAAGYRNNDFIRLERHDAYWGDAPAAASITFREVPEVAARVAGVVSGEYDMAVDIPTDQMGVVEQYDDIKSASVVLDNSHVLVFSQADPVLASRELRQALSYAIDRDLLRQALWNDENYTPNGHQLASFGDMYEADREGFTFDLERAQELVAASGYDGSPISFRLIPDYYLNGQEAAQILQEMWRAAGITVELEFVENFTAVRDEGAQIYAWSNTYRLPDPTGAIMANWGPDAAIQTRYGFFTPPEEFNTLAGEMFTTSDVAERKAKFQRMLDIFEDEAPMTILYNPVVTFIMRDDIEWTPYSLFFMDFRADNFQIGSDS
ncbi:ABC transporter substrate-binding protein [Pontivivens ytuae]|uniref:ABC transporter substrate-binding protein n=1 Tax=Pontivivens ytuae TaxID=2789856 RepID=A0A7S9LTP7_9RHOB|nr:ABC transporter substrate-binding protein [Pontivivens ytuae]QPH54949.1 ABC transporter substrate-binding protein [Pontivivens ytuae]